MDKRFAGKIVVVTGAGGGNIGRALALGFAREGARVVAVGRTESSLTDVASKIGELGGECMVSAADVSVEADVVRLFAEVSERFGPVDILLNNAAVNLKCDTVDTDVQDWDRVIDVNLRGPFLCSREALKQMIPQGHGRIINIASMAGKEALATRGAYCASKFGLLGLTEAMAAEVNHLDIVINAICCHGYRLRILSGPLSSWPVTRVVPFAANRSMCTTARICARREAGNQPGLFLSFSSREYLDGVVRIVSDEFRWHHQSSEIVDLTPPKHTRGENADLAALR
jgi:NAD(P)-dependent dehydrogenase (short-subunit alcohol dehydrogenase family)